MHDHITSITQKPTQNIHNKLKTLKKISKTQNLGLNAWMHKKIMRRRIWGDLPSDLNLDWAKNLMGWRILVRERCLDRERREIYQEKEKRMNIESHLILK